MHLNIDRSSWKKVRLGEVAFEYSKRINNPSKSEFDRFVGSSNIGQWDFRVKSWESTDSVTSAMKLFEPNDYLLVRRSLYASDFRERAPRAHFHGVCSGDILTIKENPELISDGFLVGVLNSPNLWKFVVANASGSITRRIKWSDLANYEFLLPPKDQQAKLAELLWAMDEVVEKYSININKCDDLLKSFAEKELCSKKYPREYLAKGLIKIIAGKSLNGKNIPAKGFQKGVLKVSAVGPKGFVSSENKILDNQDEFLEKFQIRKGDVLITRANTVELVGRTCLVEKDYPNLMLSDKTLKLKFNEELVEGRFLSEILRTNESRAQIESFATGTGGAMKNISQNEIESILIPFPNKSIQANLGQKIFFIKSTRDRITQSLLNAISLQKSLINQIF